MAKILLTGSGGFIGSHLKRFLDANYNVLSPRSSDLDLRDRIAVERFTFKHNVDVIVHCAACGVRITESATLDDVAQPNLQMFQNLAETEIPMIVLGSGAEYDKSRPIVNVKECEFGINVPKDPYGYSKYLISKEIELRLDHVLNLRVFGVYGANENPTRVTSSMIRDNQKHQTIKLNQNVRFSFIYIDDLCRIIDHFLRKFPKNKVVNVCSSQSIEIIELAEIVNKISGFKSDIVFRKDGLNTEYTADNSLLRNLLPDLKFTDYEDGMKTLYMEIKNG